MMALSFKRKRGRPRRDEPREINDFDLMLIKEFEQRPALYDRNHEQHRNREFLEPLWLEISNKMGYNVPILKDRMMQLRNRYNVEKRRIETAQQESPDQNVTSPWLLFEKLTFLGEHIKARRTYSTLSLPPQSPETETSEADDGEVDDYEESQPNLANGGDQISAPNVQRGKLVLRQNFVNGNDSLPNRQVTVMPTQHNNQNVILPVPKSENGEPLVTVRNTGEIRSGNEKFKAFGLFLANSLMDLNELEALRLVEKFTSDVVKSLRLEKQLKQQQQLQPPDESD